MSPQPLHVVDANEATRTALCKERGCEEDAEKTRGPYALLCPKHKREKQERRETTTPRALQQLTSSPAPLRSGTPIGYEARAKELTVLGKRLDQALAKLKPAHEAAREAKEAWKQALERLGQ